MSKKNRTSKGSASVIVLAALAIGLLATSAVTGTRATLTYVSDNYTAQLSVSQIGVSLLENGEKVSYRDYSGSNDSWSENSGKLLTKLVGENEKFVIGKKYDEKLAVSNSGDIDQYVRVRIYKSWTDANGNKNTSLSPKLINLNLTNNGWITDTKASTEERTVLYYPSILASGATTPEFADSITIDNGIASKVTETSTTDANGFTTITTTYAYDGVQFNVEAQVDAVQTHNAADAIKSAWGVDVNVAADGTLSLQ